jgi:glucitol operon activator protein
VARRFGIGDQGLLLLVVFAILALQNMLGYFFQIRQYQKMIRKWLGKGIVGVGQRRGLFMPGEICIVAYSPGEDKVLCVESMRGYSIFVRFKEKSELAGLGLEELRAAALKADARDLGLWRIIFRYKAQKVTKRKGALLQAVEGVEKRVEKKPVGVLPTAYIGAAYGDPVVETPAQYPSVPHPSAPRPVAELADVSWAELSAKEAVAKDAVAKETVVKEAAAKDAGEKKHE